VPHWQGVTLVRGRRYWEEGNPGRRGQNGTPLASAYRRTIISDAARFAVELRPGRRRSRFEATALCLAGQLELIFVADRYADPRLRCRWRETIRHANVKAALGKVALTPRQPARAQVTAAYPTNL
jgi:hypothetical protein